MTYLYPDLESKHSLLDSVKQNKIKYFYFVFLRQRQFSSPKLNLNNLGLFSVKKRVVNTLIFMTFVEELCKYSVYCH